MDTTKLLALIDRILSWLPWNGDKTKIGAILTLAYQLHEMYPNFDVLAWIDGRLLAIGIPMFIIGILHKFIRSFLKQNAPQLLTPSSAKVVAEPDLAKPSIPLAVEPVRKKPAV